MIASAAWSIVAISLFSISSHHLIRTSYSIDVWIWGVGALGIGVQFVLWLMQFPNHLKDYHYDLFELNPSRSAVIPHISTIFTRPFLITALYLAIGTVYVSSFKIFIWVVFVIVIIFWVPLVIQFINSQLAITHIIVKAKWRMLNQLQVQINKQKQGLNLSSAENIESLNKLIDLHERVYNSRDNLLTINSIFDLLNQLFLPLLAFIISNYDDVLKLLKWKP